MEQLQQHIEALIFATDRPITSEEIKECLQVTFDRDFQMEEVSSGISSLIEQHQVNQRAFEIVEIGGGFQFLTRGAYQNTVGTHLRITTKKRLSQAALETLSIIAYKQPISKGEMEAIRGVSCDYSIQKLLEKELVVITGRSDGPGRPLLYGTSEKFMDYFGLKTLQDLPRPKDFKEPENEIGERAPIEEASAEEE